MSNIKLTMFGVAGSVALLLTTPTATAAPCNGAAIDSRFAEAAKLCDPASAGPGAASSFQQVEFPATVSISMAGHPVQAMRRVPVAMPAYSRAAPPVENAPLLNAVGHAYRIDPHLLASMMHQESGGRLTAVSNKGALGLMQVMPATARSVGVADPRAMLANPVLAMSAGAVYLKRLQAQFGNNVPLVLAAYNAGPGAVLKAGMRVPRYRETQGYVGAIMTRYSQLRGVRGVRVR